MPFLSLALLSPPGLSPLPPDPAPQILTAPLPTLPSHTPSLLLTQLVVGAGLAASPYRVLGPGQDLASLEGWQCLGVDNATLDVAGRCPFTAMVQRHPR